MADKDAKVLIIDDDPQTLILLQEVMERKGLKSIACSSVKEGLAYMCSAEIKLVLLDVCMPEMNGLDLLKQIRKITPSVHVIMITGISDLDVARKCMELGAKDFITKPFDLEYLETSVLAEIIPLL